MIYLTILKAFQFIIKKKNPPHTHTRVKSLKRKFCRIAQVSDMTHGTHVPIQILQFNELFFFKTRKCPDYIL